MFYRFGGSFRGVDAGLVHLIGKLVRRVLLRHRHRIRNIKQLQVINKLENEVAGCFYFPPVKSLGMSLKEIRAMKESLANASCGGSILKSH